MSKIQKSNDSATTQAEAFEMIELAIDDLDALTRAFSMVTRVCDELNQSAFDSEHDNHEDDAEVLIN